MSEIVVILTDGTRFEVQGASWTEPPLYMPAGGAAIPGIFQNAEVEVSPEQAQEVRRKLTECLRNREPLVFGPGWRYTPLDTESMFVVVRDAAGEKVAAFNPEEVAAVYFKDKAELTDELRS